MLVGLPKETIDGEKRVLLLPDSVAALKRSGHSVVAETGLGQHLGLSDEEYRQAGAKVDSRKKTWEADVVLKLKPPQPEDFQHVRRGQIISAIFHAEGDQALSTALLRSGATAYSYEFFEDDQRQFPLMAAGSTVAGYQAVQYGFLGLQAHNGGMGILPFGPPEMGIICKVLIIGSGNLGSAAAQYAHALGCSVVVLCSSQESRLKYMQKCPQGVSVLTNTADVLRRELKEADIVIGAILISTFDTAEMITLDHVKTMKRGAVLVDGTCGYGSGYIATSKEQTTLEEPFRLSNGIVHLKIDNLPAGVPVSAVRMANHIYLPYLERFLRSLDEPDFVDPISARGKIIEDGTITHDELARHAANWAYNLDEAR